jgi:hypothetical protein
VPEQRAGAGGSSTEREEDWSAHFEREAARYRDGESRLAGAPDSDSHQRQLTRLGNAAAGAGLALLMGGRGEEARTWLIRAAGRYRESFAESPIGRYAAALACLVLGDDEQARRHADAIRTRDDFPRAVGDALAFVAARDVLGYTEAVETVLESFERRDEYLEDIPVADTVLVLQAFAASRGLAAVLVSPLLPTGS